MKKWYKSNAKIVVTIDEKFAWILWYRRNKKVMPLTATLTADRQVQYPAEMSGELSIRLAVLGAVNDLDHAALDKFLINLEPSP